MNRCAFCNTVMDDVGRAGVGPPQWVCPTCGAEESYGIEKLPDPEQLVQKGEELIELAEELDGGSVLARNLRKKFS